MLTAVAREPRAVTQDPQQPWPLDRPLRALFLLTSMPVGGAETLLVHMLRRFSPKRVLPSVACMKEPGPLGEAIAASLPVTSHWLHHKYDAAVVRRLAHHLRQQRIDAVITVGAGDKMFWGRIAARLAGVPVVCSALHSTGWPDGVGRLNRWLTPWTDRYIAVAQTHGEYLRETERFPPRKVVVIPNGVDTELFRPDASARVSVRRELGLAPSTPLIGIVAALRTEKNHGLFVDVAQQVAQRFPDAHFVIIGDGPERPKIEAAVDRAGLRERMHLLGSRSDTNRLVAALDVFALTSLNEASPVSILEALACGVPVVSTRVGSVSESVLEGWNGFTVPSGDRNGIADKVELLLENQVYAAGLGSQGREHVLHHFSLNAMVAGYENLLAEVFLEKTT